MTCLISNASLQPPVYDVYTALLIRVIPNQHFKSTLLGGGEGVTKKSTLCTLVKMMTIMDDPLRFTGAATILSFGHSMFTSLDSIGSAVGKCPIEHSIATSEWPNEY